MLSARRRKLNACLRSTIFFALASFNRRKSCEAFDFQRLPTRRRTNLAYQPKWQSSREQPSASTRVLNGKSEKGSKEERKGHNPSLEERLNGLRFTYEDRITQVGSGTVTVRSSSPPPRGLPSALCFPRGERPLGCAPLFGSGAATTGTDDLASAANLPCVEEGRCPFTKFRCSRGHVWKSVAGMPACFFCPVCAEPAGMRSGSRVTGVRPRGRQPGVTKMGIEDIRRAAKQRGGELLSDVYTGVRQQLDLRCSCGHEWQATAANLFQHKSWCPRCARTRRGRKGLGVADMRETARDFGGEFLDDEYRGSAHKHRWRCGAGHEFLQTANNIRRSEGGLRRPSFCPVCRGVP